MTSSNRKKIKVAVTGSAGQIGYALLFRLASGQVFGKDVDIELGCLELERALPAMEGVAMELDDCAFQNLKKITITSNADEAFKDANYCLLVGSVPRKDGMQRSDLLKINGGIFTSQGKAINDNAAPDVKILVVGNPCNTNCLIAQQNAPDIPADRWFAMTMLDENRAKTQLAKKAGVDVTEVKNMTIWGNHSATQYPDFHNVSISGKPATEMISDHKWLESEFITRVQKRGAEIIKARGASSAASAANAIIDSVVALHNDTPQGETYSMALVSKGEYGISEGLIFSYPCRTVNGKVEVVTGISHGGFGTEKVKITEEELNKEREIVRADGLIPS